MNIVNLNLKGWINYGRVISLWRLVANGQTGQTKTAKSFLVKHLHPTQTRHGDVYKSATAEGN